MEIKELVEYTQRVKLLRNSLEIIAVDMLEKHETSKDQQDRMGLPFSAFLDNMGDAVHNINYGLKQINESIALLESMYRRSIRLQKNVVKEDNKEETNDNER